MRPSASMSDRPMERPRVFRPGNSEALTIFIEEQKMLSVEPAFCNSEVLKSSDVMFPGFLQVRPLMNMDCFLGGSAGQESCRLSSQSAKQNLKLVKETKNKKEREIIRDFIMNLHLVNYLSVLDG